MGFYLSSILELPGASRKSLRCERGLNVISMLPLFLHSPVISLGKGGDQVVILHWRSTNRLYFLDNKTGCLELLGPVETDRLTPQPPKQLKAAGLSYTYAVEVILCCQGKTYPSVKFSGQDYCPNGAQSSV